VRRWLRRDHPALAARAKAEKGAIFWGDETGLRSDDVRGRGFAPRGRTPVVRVCQRRMGPTLISAVANKGELRWMVLDGAVKAPILIRFFQRLIQDTRSKVFLILDRLPVHRARSVCGWLAEHRASIEVFHRPSHRPELNPDEGLNADLKRVVTRKAPARSKPQPKRATISHMRRLSKSPTRIRSHFQHQPVRYAA
jgi:DDE superfamily endonuclease